MDRADSGNHQAPSLIENLGSVEIELSQDDLREIDSAAAKLDLQGARLGEASLDLTGRCRRPAKSIRMGHSAKTDKIMERHSLIQARLAAGRAIGPRWRSPNSASQYPAKSRCPSECFAGGVLWFAP
jgi:hypothetical protein